MDKMLTQLPMLIVELEALLSERPKDHPLPARRPASRGRKLTARRIQRARTLRKMGYTYKQLTALYDVPFSSLYYVLNKD